MNPLLLIDFSFQNISLESIVIAAFGYVIVFLALLTLYFVFNSLPKIIKFRIRKRLRQQGKQFENDELDIQGEVNAAIGTALYLYFSELHDDESNVITIRRVSRNYSPWNSKLYGLNIFRR